MSEHVQTAPASTTTNNVVHLAVETRPAWYAGIVRALVLAAVWIGLWAPEQAAAWYEGFFLRTACLRVQPVNVNTRLDVVLHDRTPAE
ncbi:MAG TPA: hypothetical protein VIK99_03425 [Thermaerobacter sp.]